jgi:ABC-type glycerol-3-phosphate transport system substrate-binding protein
MKKILALILAGLMLFSFAACGGNTDGETTTAAPAPTRLTTTSL